MKKLIIALILFINFAKNDLHAHKEWVHQYLALESYSYMQKKLGFGYADLKSHMGFGFFGPGSSDDKWGTGYVGVGAWREDMEDPVYLYGSSGGAAWSSTATHFWCADEGENAPVHVPSFGDVENAWQKARVYLFGGRKIFFEKRANIGPEIITGRFYKYNSLVDFYLTGNCTYEGYMTIDGIIKNEFGGPIPIVMDQTSRDRYVYIILGRVAHLLADVGVPAHAHGDPHNCGFPHYDRDEYELYMGNNAMGGCDDPHTWFPAKYYNSNNIGGSLVHEIESMTDYEAMKYLFYTQNQLADFFPSDDANPNNNLPQGSNPYLLARYSALGSPPSSINVYDIASESMAYTIRATASLFYWFARKTNQQQIYSPYISSVNYDRPGEYFIYKGQNAIFTCNATGSNVQYDWDIFACGFNINTCNNSIPGVQINKNGNTLTIKNLNFLNS